MKLLASEVSWQASFLPWKGKYHLHSSNSLTKVDAHAKRMLPLLATREIGLADGLYFRRTEKSRRATAIQLSHDRNMEAAFTSGINSLDIEKQDNRLCVFLNKRFTYCTSLLL